MIDVLLVDDDEDLRSAMADVLEDAGYRVAQACDGRDALTKLAQISPRVIVLDLSMPVLDGIGFCQERDRDERLRAIPVILLSAAGQLAEWVKEISVREVMPKPIDVIDLLAVVKRALG